MLKSLLPGLWLWLLITQSCVQKKEQEPAGTGRDVALILQHKARRVFYKVDSTRQVAYSSKLLRFYNSLAEKQNLVIDTSWYQNLDKEWPFEDQYIQRPRFGDNPPGFIAFPFTDMGMTYNDGEKEDYFLVNGWRIPEKIYASDNRFFVSSIRRFSYKGKNYLVFNGGLADYNGYGGRINFNYFFDLSGKRPVADMYKNCWGFVDAPFLYGELNNDNDLDRVRFDGVCRPSDLPVDVVTITAETYRGGKWQPLNDAEAKPYFIELLMDEDRNGLKLGASNWMKPVSLD